MKVRYLASILTSFALLTCVHAQVQKCVVLGAAENESENRIAFEKSRTYFLKNHTGGTFFNGAAETIQAYREAFPDDKFFELKPNPELVIYVDRDIKRIKQAVESKRLLELVLKHLDQNNTFEPSKLNNAETEYLKTFLGDFGLDSGEYSLQNAKFGAYVATSFTVQGISGDTVTFDRAPKFGPMLEDLSENPLHIQRNKGAVGGDETNQNDHIDLFQIGKPDSEDMKVTWGQFEDLCDKYEEGLTTVHNDLVQKFQQQDGESFGANMVGSQSLGFNNLSKSMKDDVVRRARRDYEKLGFSSPEEAESFFRNAKYDVGSRVAIGFVPEGSTTGNFMVISQEGHK